MQFSVALPLPLRKALTERMMADTKKQEDDDMTQAWIVDKDGKTLETDKWHMLPTYRLELTLFHIVRNQQPSRKTTVIKKDYESWNNANAAALQLAVNCRSSGESVMLVKRKEGDVDILHQYAVGIWNWKDDWSGKVPCKWSLIHDWERERWHSHRKGDISGYVKVVRWWKGPLMSPYEGVALDALQRSDDGSPPLGVPAESSYEFMGYRLRNTRTWQPITSTSPLSWLQPEELAGLSSMLPTHTLRQFPPNSWRTRNLTDAILGLEQNIETIRLAYQQPRDLQVCFDPKKTKLGNLTDITWRLSKKSVVARDVKAFESKLRLLNLQRASHAVANLPSIWPSAERSKTINDLELQLCKLEGWDLKSEDDISTPITSIVPARSPEDHEPALGQVKPELAPGRLTTCVFVVEAWLQNFFMGFWKGLRRFVVFALMLPRDIEGPIDAEKLSDPSICLCTAHQWRRANFPRHRRLPAVPKREEADQSDVPRQARDPTYVPRHVQHFIPESKPKPKPRTLRGYIRRQLETGWPVPRQKYIDFKVMTELDCRTRWGPNWRLQSEKEQEEWDGYRNVRKQQRNVSAPKTGEPPEDELYG